MTTVTIFGPSGRAAAVEATDDPVRIKALLGAIGVDYERHPAPEPLPPGADAAYVLKLYARLIARFQADGDYRSADVVRLLPTAADRVAQRQKFLHEHTHDDDEVRYFVEGSGTFYLRAGESVVELRGERGDLIRVPAGARHWFDTGMPPYFTAIRLFTRPDGWVGHFTGNRIAERFVHPAG